MIKGLLVLLAVFCVLVALLVWAKSRPAVASAMIKPVSVAEMSLQTLKSSHA